MGTAATIRAFIAGMLSRKADKAPFADSESLVSRGRLDSVDVMEIVLFLEEKYDLDFADRGFNLDDYDSVDHILALLNEFGRIGAE